MQKIISKLMRQIRAVETGVKRQLKKMLNELGYEFDVIYDESPSYVIVDMHNSL